MNFHFNYIYLYNSWRVFCPPNVFLAFFFHPVFISKLLLDAEILMIWLGLSMIQVFLIHISVTVSVMLFFNHI